MLIGVDINHLNLGVRDPGTCRDFYQRHFGFRPAFEAEGGYFIRNDEGFLLALIPAPDHQPLPNGFHIGFGVDAPNALPGYITNSARPPFGSARSRITDPPRRTSRSAAGIPTAPKSKSSGRRDEPSDLPSPSQRGRRATEDESASPLLPPAAACRHLDALVGEDGPCHSTRRRST